MSIEDTLSDFIKRPKCSLSLIDRDLIEFEIFEKSGDKHSNASSSRGEQEQFTRASEHRRHLPKQCGWYGIV